MHKLDNEASRDVIEWIKKQQQAKIELTSPDMHHHNLSKQSVQTWKDHFIASLVPQANMTLNLL
eukprot:5030091-Ditylum_brightwellii.AAC.1